MGEPAGEEWLEVAVVPLGEPPQLSGVSVGVPLFVLRQLGEVLRVQRGAQLVRLAEVEVLLAAAPPASSRPGCVRGVLASSIDGGGTGVTIELP